MVGEATNFTFELHVTGTFAEDWIGATTVHIFYMANWGFAEYVRLILNGVQQAESGYICHMTMNHFTYTLTDGLFMREPLPDDFPFSLDMLNDALYGLLQLVTGAQILNYQIADGNLQLYMLHDEVEGTISVTNVGTTAIALPANFITSGSIPRLSAPILNFDEENKIIWWEAVENATDYELFVRSERGTPAFNDELDRWEFILTGVGSFYIEIRTLGNGVQWRDSFFSTYHFYIERTEFDDLEEAREWLKGYLDSWLEDMESMNFLNATGLYEAQKLIDDFIENYDGSLNVNSAWLEAEEIIATIVSNEEWLAATVLDLIKQQIRMIFLELWGYTEEQLIIIEPIVEEVLAEYTEAVAWEDAQDVFETIMEEIFELLVAAGVKTIERLQPPEVFFDYENGIIYFYAVDNASSYALLVNNEEQTAAWNEKMQRYEFQLTSYGNFTAGVTALGGETETYIFTDSQEATITGNFAEPRMVTLTVVNGTGTVTVVEGTWVTAEATVPDGKIFVSWEVNGGTISLESFYSFDIWEDMTLTATFEDECAQG